MAVKNFFLLTSSTQSSTSNLLAIDTIHSARYHRAVRWLLHGNLTTATGDALRRHGHQVVELPEVIGKTPGDPPADPALVLAAAKKAQLDVLTADAAMAAAPFEIDAPFNRSMVFLQLAGGDVEQDDAIDRLFARYKRLTPGRLYTVTGSRVKVRQLPTM